jgi:hypothetical protein
LLQMVHRCICESHSLFRFFLFFELPFFFFSLRFLFLHFWNCFNFFW